MYPAYWWSKLLAMMRIRACPSLSAPPAQNEGHFFCQVWGTPLDCSAIWLILATQTLVDFLCHDLTGSNWIPASRPTQCDSRSPFSAPATFLRTSGATISLRFSRMSVCGVALSCQTLSGIEKGARYLSLNISSASRSPTNRLAPGSKRNSLFNRYEMFPNKQKAVKR